MGNSWQHWWSVGSSPSSKLLFHSFVHVIDCREQLKIGKFVLLCVVNYDDLVKHPSSLSYWLPQSKFVLQSHSLFQAHAQEKALRLRLPATGLRLRLVLRYNVSYRQLITDDSSYNFYQFLWLPKSECLVV